MNEQTDVNGTEDSQKPDSESAPVERFVSQVFAVRPMGHGLVESFRYLTAQEAELRMSTADR